MKANNDYVSVTEIAGDEVTQEQIDRLCNRYYWAGQCCSGKDVVEAVGRARGRWSSRQGCNPAGESPAAPITRFRRVAMPHLGVSNYPSYAWCKRPGRSEDSEPQRWVQPGGLASVGA